MATSGNQHPTEAAVTRPNINRKTVTYQEIMEQPNAWRRALADARARWPEIRARLGDALSANELVVHGCGSSYYLAEAAAAQFRLTQRQPVTALPSSELLVHTRAALGATRPYTLVAISRSGETTETIRATEHARREHSAPVLTVSCTPNSGLARRGDASLVVESGRERSVVMTKSFTSMLLALQVVAARLSDIPLDAELVDSQLDRLPDVLERLLPRYVAMAESAGAREFQKRVFLGSGPYYGLAREANLKMKEMAIVTSEVYHNLEFRHGPISIVDDSTLVVVFISDAGHEYEVPLLAELKTLGATLFVVAEQAEPTIAASADYLVELRSGLSEAARAVLYLPLCQVLAYACAVTRGENPDHPRNLTQVVKLK